MKLGEFELISRLLRKINFIGGNVLVPAGDDTAVIKDGESFLFITSDALVEGSHYAIEWKEHVRDLYYYLGRKLLSISLSDVSSMGGSPDFAIVNVGLTDNYSIDDVERLYDGLSDCAKEYKTSIVGGDTVKSKNEFFDLTLVGKSTKGFMLRRNAVPGDLVGVTGTFGDASVGLKILKGELKFKGAKYFLDRFLNPTPRIEVGKFLLSMGVRCCTDVSDGFLFNLGTIAESSKVAINVLKSHIPISDKLKNVENALSHALYGGEDYELIFTFRENLIDRIEREGLRVVGVVREGKGVYIDDEPVSTFGFEHFRRES